MMMNTHHQYEVLKVTIETIHTQEPAFSVIEKLGGKAYVADELGLDKSTLSRWCQSKPSGTGGVIPQKHWGKLLEVAAERRVRLTLKELAAIEA
jgi:hypothetical protein